MPPNCSKKTLFRFDKSTSNAIHGPAAHDPSKAATASAATAAGGTDATDASSPLPAVTASTSTGAAEHHKQRLNMSDTSANEPPQSAGPAAKSAASSVKPTPPVSSARFGGNAPHHLVCAPDANLVRIVYVPLIAVLHELEALLKHKSSAPCALHTFLTAHVRDTFLANGHSRTLELTVDGLAKNQEAWRTVVSAEEARSLGLQRPLLQSTVLFEKRK